MANQMQRFSTLRGRLSRWIDRTQITPFLHGEGIEIGALHAPFDLSGSRVTKISYVDRMPVEELRRHYPELNLFQLVKVDIIDDGEKLESIPNNSLDFIIANNLIEHLSNPISALKNWYQHLRPGGCVCMIVPDKRFTFDRGRPKTPIQHLVEDYEASQKERQQRDFFHYVEIVEILGKRTGKDAQDHAVELISSQYSIHYHCWDYSSFRTFINFVSTNKEIPFTILRASHFPGKKTFVFILGKAK
jgi:SAM-dependent methyltransferase